MNICKVWDADYPWDVRVAKVTRSLTDAGHNVHLVCRNRSGLASKEQRPEATIHRLRHWPLSKRLNELSSFPAFFNPRWFSRILGVCTSQRVDLILVRDLPLAPTAIAAGRLRGIPVVLDMAENYGAMTQSLFNNGVARPTDWIVRHPGIVRYLERWVLRHIDHTIVVVEESADRLVSLGLDASRLTVVGNTPPRTRLDEVAARVHSADTLHLNYLGLLEAPRGLGVVIDALSECKRLGLNVLLTIIGDGRERARFERQAVDLGLTDGSIRFCGFVPNAEALQLVASADIGLIPHQANESWNTTIPNKLFDYMAAGLAVITSDAAPAARIVRSVGAGEVYPWCDPLALTSAIQRLVDPVRRTECGLRGRHAIAQEYHWDRDAERLLKALNTTSGIVA